MTYLVEDDGQDTRRPFRVGLGLLNIWWRRGQVLLGGVRGIVVGHHFHLGRSLGGLRSSLGLFGSRCSLELLDQGCFLEVSDRPDQFPGHIVGILKAGQGVFSSDHLVGSLHELGYRDLDSANQVTNREHE
jgi:hypothetical protein